MSYNEHTKKKMQTGIPSEDYRKHWDLIFKKEVKKNKCLAAESGSCYCTGECKREDDARNSEI